MKCKVILLVLGIICQSILKAQDVDEVKLYEKLELKKPIRFPNDANETTFLSNVSFKSTIDRYKNYLIQFQKNDSTDLMELELLNLSRKEFDSLLVKKGWEDLKETPVFSQFLYKAKSKNLFNKKIHSFKNIIGTESFTFVVQHMLPYKFEKSVYKISLLDASKLNKLTFINDLSNKSRFVSEALRNNQSNSLDSNYLQPAMEMAFDEILKSLTKSEQVFRTLLHEGTFVVDEMTFGFKAEAQLQVEEGKKYRFRISTSSDTAYFYLGNLSSNPELFQERLWKTILEKLMDESKAHQWEAQSSTYQNQLSTQTMGLLITTIAKDFKREDDAPIAGNILVRNEAKSFRIVPKGKYKYLKKRVMNEYRRPSQEEKDRILVGERQSENSSTSSGERSSFYEDLLRNSKYKLPFPWLTRRKKMFLEHNEPNLLRYLSFLSDEDLNTEFRAIKIDSVEIEFFEGSIKNIIVLCKMERDNGTTMENMIYHNAQPIAFSDFNDYKKFNKIALVPFHSNSYAIFLRDVLSYKPMLHLFTEDYSPRDTVQFFKPTVPGSIKLHKDNTINLFQTRVYSDFIGLNEKNPNGLIQVEFNKKIILNPNRWRIGNRIARTGLYWGIGNFVDPSLTWSKIDGNNLHLPVRTDTSAMTNYASTVNAMRYSNLSAAVNFNVLTIDWRSIKSSFYLNGGVKFSQVQTLKLMGEDSLFSSANMIIPQADVMWDIKPDPRFGIDLGYRVSFPKLESDDFRMVETVARDLPSSKKSKYPVGAFTFNAVLRASENQNNKNEVFFRASYNHQWGEAKENYFTAQLGYSIYLLKK